MSAVETQTDSTYDVVTVDLSDGRDYPIFIGDGFDDEEAGKLLRSHIKGNRALLITNDKVGPLYLEKYEKLLKEGGDIQIGMLHCSQAVKVSRF
jgi:3-dehydroquinate synthase